MATSTALQDFELRCNQCPQGSRDVLGDFACPSCGEPMSLVAGASPDDSVFASPPESMWDYFDLLPVEDRANVVTMNEGATPLVNAPRLAGEHGFGQVLLKNDTLNPTGSFKDRQVSVGISHAKEIGADTVAVVSSGNVACAASAYAARAGMRAVLLMHGQAAPNKIAQAAAYGGRCIKVDLPEASRVFELCIEACEKLGWYHLSTAGIYNPFNVEGAKTIAYELYAQTGGDLPEWIVAPVGGGGLLGGIWRGFLDLQRLGLIEKPPRIAGVQATGCAPLKKAIDEGQSFLETLDDPWPDPHSVAGGIADDILFDGHTALPAVRTTDGAAIAVTDEEIIAGELALASAEGILGEPCASTTIAALKHLPDAGPETTVCCVLTGTGIKDLDVLADAVPPAPTVEPTLEALERIMDGTP
jgi:threonine synthase